MRKEAADGERSKLGLVALRILNQVAGSGLGAGLGAVGAMNLSGAALLRHGPPTGGKLVAMLAATLAGGVGGNVAGRRAADAINDRFLPVKQASSVEIDERTIRRERDEKALRNRHIALALKRAIQGGLLGAGIGGIGAAKEEGGMDGNEGALLGLLSGGLAGAGLGAAEGGIKRSLGLDPTLQTFLTAQRA